MSDVERDGWGSPEDRVEKALAWISVARDLVRDDPDYEGDERYLDASALLVSRLPEFADEFARLAHARSRGMLTIGIDPLPAQLAVLPIFIDGLLKSVTEPEGA